MDRQKAGSYAAVAEDFLRAADLAIQHEYWNAAGLLLVHASIAFTDAVWIKLAGMKSTSESHQDAVTLLKESDRRPVFPSPPDRTAGDPDQSQPNCTSNSPWRSLGREASLFAPPLLPKLACFVARQDADAVGLKDRLDRSDRVA